MVSADVPGRTEQAASHWSQVARAIHDAIRPNAQQDKRDHLTSVLDQFENELAPLLAPIVADLAQHPDTPEPIRGLLNAIAGPEHFTQSLLIGIALGSVISPVLGTATAPFVQQLANSVWPANPVVPLTPPLLAAAVLKGIMDEKTGADLAALTGTNPHNFHVMYEAAGQAPGIAEGLLLWRRGDIDEPELDKIIKYSNVRFDFAKDIKKLRYAPPGVGEVIAGLTKGHLTVDEATVKLSDAGINPENLDWLHKTAGRPPGIEQMLQLWNRNQATELDVDAAILQSDINDLYLPFVKKLREYRPPPRSIVPMLRAGGIDEARARELLLEHGVRPVDIDAFIAEAHTSRTQALRELSASQVVRAYEERLIDQPTAHARLLALRFVDADATLMLEIADTAVLERYRNSGIARIHNRYVAHKITHDQATQQLATFGIPGPAITAMVTIWDDERAANTAVLSLAQNQGAYHRKIITLPQFIARVHALGYSGLDVKIIAAEAWPPTKVPAEVIALDPANL